MKTRYASLRVIEFLCSLCDASCLIQLALPELAPVSLRMILSSSKTLFSIIEEYVCIYKNMLSSFSTRDLS